MGILAEPPAPEPPRAAQPDPLTPAELHSIRVVCFLPRSPTSTANDNNQNNNASIRPDVTRLPYPPVYLAEESATCAICQENFQPPAEGRTIMLRAEPLRQLGCGHVFHVRSSLRRRCIPRFYVYRGCRLTRRRQAVSMSGF